MWLETANNYLVYFTESDTSRHCLSSTAKSSVDCWHWWWAQAAIGWRPFLIQSTVSALLGNRQPVFSHVACLWRRVEPSDTNNLAYNSNETNSDGEAVRQTDKQGHQREEDSWRGRYMYTGRHANKCCRHTFYRILSIYVPVSPLERKSSHVATHAYRGVHPSEAAVPTLFGLRTHFAVKYFSRTPIALGNIGLT